MIRWLMRRKRKSLDEAVPAFDFVRPLSGRLADPVLPPMLIQLPAASLRFGSTTADSLQTPIRRIDLR